MLHVKAKSEHPPELLLQHPCRVLLGWAATPQVTGVDHGTIT